MKRPNENLEVIVIVCFLLCIVAGLFSLIVGITKELLK